jgi:hypothetical protein
MTSVTVKQIRTLIDTKNTRELSILIKKNPEIKDFTIANKGLVTYAIETGDDITTKTLITLGCTATGTDVVNAFHKKLKTTLKEAVKYAQGLDSVDEFITLNSNQATIMAVALIKKGANPTSSNLCKASKDGSLKVLEAAHAKKLSLDTIEKDDSSVPYEFQEQSPLSVAIKNTQTEVAAFLIRTAKCTNDQHSIQDLVTNDMADAITAAFEQTLHLNAITNKAIELSKDDIAARGIEAGANPTSSNLCKASKDGSLKVLEAAHAKGLSLDTIEKDDSSVPYEFQEQSPLSVAIKNNQTEVAVILLGAGCKHDQGSMRTAINNGDTKIINAAILNNLITKNSIELIQLITANNLDENLKTLALKAVEDQDQELFKIALNQKFTLLTEDSDVVKAVAYSEDQDMKSLFDSFKILEEENAKEEEEEEEDLFRDLFAEDQEEEQPTDDSPEKIVDVVEQQQLMGMCCYGTEYNHTVGECC